MPFTLPPSVFPLGLTTQSALDRLLAGIDAELAARTFSWRTALERAASPANVTSLFPWTSACFALLQALLLLVVGLAGSGGGDRLWYFLEAAVVATLAAANVLLNVHEQKLRASEMTSRVRHVARRLRQVKPQIAWRADNYPHLHTPLAASVVLQWTIRDGRHVNLPWALLVEKDVVLIKPGQAVPGNCHALDTPELRMQHGDILHIKTHTDDVISPTPEFKTPALPQIFIMDETPYLNIVRKVLEFHEEEKPPSILFKLSYFFFTKMLVHILLPAFFFLTIMWNVLRHNQEWSFYGAKDLVHLFLVDPIAVTLPLLSLTFPISWTVVNYMGLAWILGVYTSSRHLKMTDDPFDDTLEDSEMKSKNKVSCWQMQRYFASAILGRGEYLSRTENIVHTLGSITALCCSDKKGLLSWPNASPEKIFVVKKVAARVDEAGDVGVGGGDFSLVPEILTVTHDHHNPFKVEFDDPGWHKYMDFLKPLGLGILLNTCNISTEEKYTNFFNHLICESIRVGESAAGGDQQQQQQQAGIDMLPIVTRGCLCELASKIGFSSRIASQYALSSQIQTFRHVQPSLNDKFARNLSRAMLKFPFPHLVSVIVQHRTTGARQLISQGTADIVLDSCTDCWSGSDLEVLTEDIRKKMLDFYQRASLSSYCTAFALRPHTFSLPWKDCREYLQLPTHSNPFYWHHNELSEFVDADAVTSHISAGTKTENDLLDTKRGDSYVKTKEDAMLCLELECNQTFLGMIQLQYQVVVDMVQLIDLLEKACIRFVHFSKENELRSRVFSEKMGLESGWNCHISLKSSKMPRYETILRGADSKRSGNGSDSLKKHNRLGSSLPDYLNRPAWFLDFPKWKEMKGTWANGERISSTAQLVVEDEMMRGASATPEPVNESSRHSRHASANSDSDDPFEYDMSNRAQLPRGIENIRPHLETMDNVPLLVSLFTDCTPPSTIEMLKIMQEYGEVVCVMGSSANYKNIEIFLQADASLAIEPRYPQLCQRVPVSAPTKSGPSPVAISQLLISVASSLSFKMEDEISIFHLILESRHFTLSLINAMKFWICCLLTISCLQYVSLVFTLPLFMTPGQTLWMTLVIIPLLSLSLMGTKTDPNVMNISTGKNNIILNFDTIKYCIWCYGSRFVPTIAILILGHLLSVVDLRRSCQESQRQAQQLAANETVDVSNDTTYHGHCHANEIDDDPELSELLDLPQYLNFVFAFLFLTCISMSFISRGHQLWERHPGHNSAWLFAVAILLGLIMILTLAIAFLARRALHVAGLSVWLVWLCGLVIVTAVNEVIKRFEIKVDVRYQKRERLEFGTKLGMNSPF